MKKLVNYIWLVAVFSAVSVFAITCFYDTDGGNNPWVQGTVYTNTTNYTDYCIGNSTLVEYYCENSTLQSQNYTCLAGCVSGACLTEKGDSNCDNAVNFGDINAFTLALSGQSGWEAQYDCDYMDANDINDDGYVDYDDINPFIDLIS